MQLYITVHILYLFILVYYIQIDTNELDHIFTIKADFDKPPDISCLKFRHHLYGSDVKYLQYGYYTVTTQRIVVKNITRQENFWHCSTFVLSSIPESATVSISFIFYHEDKQKGNTMKERFKDTHVPGNQTP